MKLNCSFPINQLSYGVVGLNLTLELYKLLGPDNICLWPINPNPSVNTSKEDAQIIEKCINNTKTLNYDPNSPSLRVWHQFNLEQRIGRGKAIAWPIFELNKFNDVELLHLRSQDELIACSEWGQKILKENVDLPVHRVPLGVNSDIFKPIEVQEWEVTRFLCVGKTEVRKGHDLLGAVFNDAFESSDNVELLISWDSPFLTEAEKTEWINLYKDTKLGDKIKFIPYQQSPHQLNLIYNSVDCLVSLSRAEGWNLPLLEGLACGKKVIATEYSGHTEFLDGTNCFTIEITELETAYDGKWFHGQGEWANIGEYQIEQCIEGMRKIHKLKQASGNLFNEEGIKTAKLFSWENSAKMLMEVIQ